MQIYANVFVCDFFKLLYLGGLTEITNLPMSFFEVEYCLHKNQRPGRSITQFSQMFSWHNFEGKVIGNVKCVIQLSVLWTKHANPDQKMKLLFAWLISIRRRHSHSRYGKAERISTFKVLIIWTENNSDRSYSTNRLWTCFYAVTVNTQNCEKLILQCLNSFWN